MTRAEMWLESEWSFVTAALPAPPAEVLEIGCGKAGGFVPFLLRDGYTAVGVDPAAPEGPAYRQAEFESYEPPRPVDAVVASTSLHHVADLDLAVDRVAAALKPNGSVVVVEWASERFDEATARWCFARLPDLGPEEEPGWLAQGQEHWRASGQPWADFLAAWRDAEGLHPGGAVVRALNARFTQRSCAYGPYFFADLDGVTRAGEQAAIDAGEIQATGIRYTASRRPA